MDARTLVVACAIFLAGCGGFPVSDGPEVITPAPVPTDGVQYPPGATADGVVPSVLANAHAGSLSTTSYTLSARQEIRDADGDVVRRTERTHWVAPNASTYRGRFEQNVSEYRTGPATTRVDYWANRTIVATRYVNERGEVTLLRWPAGNGDLLADLSDEQRLAGELAAVETRVAGRTDDGGVVLVSTRARETEELTTPLFVSDVENVTVRMRVRYDGVVVARRLAYDATLGSRSVHVVRTVRVTNLGVTTVERPVWVDETTMSER
ncbi:hypothetical protein EGH23_09610 [Halomicroarcula sp. F27]|uniref:Lipoprotein n=2 Tax=Haloarcula nitratireducens TaxID=2487749 RepID=A0AAW4PBE3_9EURY|nr:hypothetical protein [Halomicroarcula nitratireducens]